MDAETISPELISKLLLTHRIDLTTEKVAQQGIASVLEQRGIPYIREARLSPQDIPDFLIESSGLAIEVKMKGARKAAVFRQLRRYAGHEQVKTLLLVTNLSMSLPKEIDGKPAHCVSLGRAWL